VSVGPVADAALDVPRHDPQRLIHIEQPA